ncbi:MAG TPA: rod shape-determining protein [Spirochaetia bacterium]|nr:rod shape-determining protein [Spirochaetia bacterium]
MFGNLFTTPSLGIDLGTANTLVYVKGEGIVLSEPSVVAVDSTTREVLAIGEDAKKMLGRTPNNIIAIRPLHDGVIADFEIVEKMIKYFIKKITPYKWVKPRVVIGIPAGITEVEKRAVRESAQQSGVKEVYLIEESLAAAIGANMPIQEPSGNMVVDIGGGTTEISVISLGNMVKSNTLRIGGDEFDDAIIQYAKKNHNLIIGERTAEEIKVTIGNAYPTKEVMKMEIKGRDSLTGLPRVLTIDSDEIRESLKEQLNNILEGITNTLEETPPELSADIMERGIVLAGGGALLKGLPEFISKETNVPVFLADNPLTCVVLGAGRYLDELEKMKKRKI